MAEDTQSQIDDKKEQTKQTSVLQEASANLKEANEIAKKSHRDAAVDNQESLLADGQGRDLQIKNLVQQGVWDDQKKKRDELLDKDVARGIAVAKGETGFAGLRKSFGEGFGAMIESNKTIGDRLGDIKGAFADDLGFLGAMMAPLTALPGMNTAMTILKSVGGGILSLGTKEGRARAKEAILTAKQFVVQKAQWVWQKMVAMKTFALAMATAAATKLRAAKTHALALKDILMKKAHQAWEKIQTAKNRLMTRARGLKEKGLKRGKSGMKKAGNWLAKAGKIILSLVVGLFVMIGAFAAEVLKPFKVFFSRIGAKVAGIFKGFKLPTRLTKAITSVKTFFGSKGPMGRAFSFITKIFSKIGAVISKLLNPRIIGFMRGIGGTLGKLFWPITLLMGAWEAVKGFISGFKSTEGGIGERIMGGILGAWQSLVDYLVMWPLDLIKDLIVWIGEKMNFDMSTLKGFSFQEMWKEISDKFIDGVMAVVRFVKAIAVGIGAGIAALWPGGEGPMEAFKRAFDETMAKPGGGKATTIEKPEGGTGEAMQKSQKDLDDARDLKNYQDANREYAMNKARQEGKNVNSAVAISVTNEGSKIINDGTTPDEKTADGNF